MELWCFSLQPKIKNKTTCCVTIKVHRYLLEVSCCTSEISVEWRRSCCLFELVSYLHRQFNLRIHAQVGLTRIRPQTATVQGEIAWIFESLNEVFLAVKKIHSLHIYSQIISVHLWLGWDYCHGKGQSKPFCKIPIRRAHFILKIMLQVNSIFDKIVFYSEKQHKAILACWGNLSIFAWCERKLIILK